MKQIRPHQKATRLLNIRYKMQHTRLWHHAKVLTITVTS